MGYSLSSGPYRYTEWVKRPGGEVVARELYDLTAGATPAANLAEMPRHAVTVRSLSALLQGGLGWREVRARVGV